MDEWEELVYEGKVLRREIRAIAEEYGAGWDEQSDEIDGDKVVRLLNEGERGGGGGGGGGGEGLRNADEGGGETVRRRRSKVPICGWVHIDTPVSFLPWVGVWVV